MWPIILNCESNYARNFLTDPDLSIHSFIHELKCWNELKPKCFCLRPSYLRSYVVPAIYVHVNKPSSPKKKIAYRNLRSINIDDFRQDIVNLDLLLSPSVSLTSLCDQYDIVLMSILDSHAPEWSKTIYIEKACSALIYWWHCLHENYIRRKLERRWSQTKLSVDQQLHSDQCLLINNLVFSTKMQYYSNLLDDAGSDHICSFLKPLTDFYAKNLKYFIHPVHHH